MRMPRAFGAAVLGLLLSCALGSIVLAIDEAEKENLRQVVSLHLERYPDMEIRDLYKLIFQAAMGSEHAVPDREMAQQWLERELSMLEASSNEPFSEPLSPDGALVRVNLRAYIERGGDADRLLDAFVETASRFQGSQERLERYWSHVEALALEGEIPFEITQIQALGMEMKSQGFPAVHHSTPYRDRYDPAYRVVLLDLLRSETVAVSGQ